MSGGELHVERSRVVTGPPPEADWSVPGVKWLRTEARWNGRKLASMAPIAAELIGDSDAAVAAIEDYLRHATLHSLEAVILAEVTPAGLLECLAADEHEWLEVREHHAGVTVCARCGVAANPLVIFRPGPPVRLVPLHLVARS